MSFPQSMVESASVNPQHPPSVGSLTRCSFCGKSQGDVRVIVTSGKSAICDECIFLAFDTMNDKRTPLYLRVAYSAFKVIATIGHRLTYRMKRSK
jgi:ClpX C4-type zinc finger